MITTWMARAAKMTGVQRRRRSENLERLPPASGTVIKLSATTAMRNTVGAHLLAIEADRQQVYRRARTAPDVTFVGRSSARARCARNLPCGDSPPSQQHVKGLGS